MAGFYGVSAYQQTDQSWKTGSSPLKNEKTKAAKKPEGEEAPKNGAVTKENAFSNVSVKNWSPLDSGSSLSREIQNTAARLAMWSFPTRRRIIMNS